MVNQGIDGSTESEVLAHHLGTRSTEFVRGCSSRNCHALGQHGMHPEVELKEDRGVPISMVNAQTGVSTVNGSDLLLGTPLHAWR